MSKKIECEDCEGEGYYRRGGKVHDCEECQGMGYFKKCLRCPDCRELLKNGKCESEC